MREREHTHRRVNMSRDKVGTPSNLIAITLDGSSILAADQAHKTARRSAHFITRAGHGEQALARLRGKPFARSRNSHHPHRFSTSIRELSGWSSEARPTHEDFIT